MNARSLLLAEIMAVVSSMWRNRPQQSGCLKEACCTVQEDQGKKYRGRPCEDAAGASDLSSLDELYIFWFWLGRGEEGHGLDYQGQTVVPVRVCHSLVTSRSW
jgi:hypothetical protein